MQNLSLLLLLICCMDYLIYYYYAPKMLVALAGSYPHTVVQRGPDTAYTQGVVFCVPLLHQQSRSQGEG